jgi:hypothetical protein
MSLDRRVREALEREADEVQPDVARHLEATITRAERRDRPGAVGLLAGAAVAVALLALLSRLPLGPVDDGIGARSPSPAPSPSAVAPVVGAWTATLGPETAPIDGLHLGGTWTLVIAVDGTLHLTAPAGFEGSRPTGHAWSVAGDRWTTDLWYNDYGHATGSYAWARSGAELRLTGSDDPCAIRRTLLTAGPWTRAP